MLEESALHLNPFDAQAKEFSLPNALFLAKCAELAYHEHYFIEYVVKDLWKFSQFEFVEYHDNGLDTEGFVIANEESIIITFRGSESSIGDWINNIDIALVPAFNVAVHRGFFLAFNCVQENLWQVVDKFNTNNQTIWITGHSQGGALATLATAQLQFWNQSINGLYTFGQPRVGDEMFRLWFNGTCKNFSFRIVNHKDKVTHLPPESKGFSHAGTYVFLTDDERLEFDTETWNMEKDSFSALLDDMFDFALEKTVSHNMDTYVQKLERLYQQRF